MQNKSMVCWFLTIFVYHPLREISLFPLSIEAILENEPIKYNSIEVMDLTTVLHTIEGFQCHARRRISIYQNYKQCKCGFLCNFTLRRTLVLARAHLTQFIFMDFFCQDSLVQDFDWKVSVDFTKWLSKMAPIDNVWTKYSWIVASIELVLKMGPGPAKNSWVKCLRDFSCFG
jgi:hypothetical protein